MRVYKTDGTFTDKPEDVEFGWYLKDISIDEAQPNYQRENERLMKSTSDKDYEKTLDLEDEMQFVIVDNLEPRVKMCPVESVIEPNLEPEGVECTASELQNDKMENIDSKVPSKQQVASLINPCSVESKMLLAVVHYAKYRHLIKSKIVDLGDLKGSSNIKFLINDKAEEEDLMSEIENFNETNEDNMLSLMMQLILADINCDVADITNTNQTNGSKYGESSDLGNSISDTTTSSENDDEMQLLPKFDPQNQNFEEPPSSLGVSEIIDKSIDRICEETYDIHLNIAEIRKSFQIDELKVNALIRESQSLEKGLRETKYLEELVHLLNGDLHKVTSKKWPFKIFLQNPDDRDINFII